MNPRHFVKMMLSVALLLSPALLGQKLQPIPQPIERRQFFPDLVPVDVTLGEGCRIIVALRNNGPGIVPDAGFSLSPPSSSGVQMYMDGSPWGGLVLGALDPSHAVQPAGGTVSYAWFPGLALPPGAHVIKLDVDNNNVILESNELNNSLTKTLTCTPPLPDLQPVSFALQSTGPALNSPCRIILTVRNNGPAIVPDAAFAQVPTSPTVQMYLDGAPWGGTVLGGVDPGKALQPVGGTVTYPWMGNTSNLLVAPGQHTMRVDVDNFNVLAESNEANNSLTQTLMCGAVILPPTIR